MGGLAFIGYLFELGIGLFGLFGLVRLRSWIVGFSSVFGVILFRLLVTLMVISLVSRFLLFSVQFLGDSSVSGCEWARGAFSEEEFREYGYDEVCLD